MIVAMRFGTLFLRLRRAVAPSLFAVIFDWTRSNYSLTRAPPLDAEYEAVLCGLEQVVLGGCGFAVPNGARESSDAKPRLVGATMGAWGDVRA
jgi:hypothetical protein